MSFTGNVLAQSESAKGPPCKVLSELDGLSVVVSIFGLDDCWEYPGILYLENDTVFNQGGKQIMIPAGSRSAVLKQETDRTILLNVDVDTKEYGIPFRLPKGFQLPSEGPFFLAADQSKQTVDLDGSIDINFSQSEEYSAIENCSYSVLEYYSGDSTYCETRSYNDGESRVRYYFDIAETNLLMELLEVGGSAYMGDFSSSILDRKKIYTYRSSCLQRRQDDWRC